MPNWEPAKADAARGTALSSYRFATLALASAALLYAFFAGFRTAADPDLGWLMATGRFVVQHHSVPSTDVFSYTAAGREWIYPPFAGVIFYALFLAGGYTAISWFSAAACAGTAALMITAEWGNTLVAALCAIAVPVLAARTAPRANLFTVVLFAAFLNLLWRYHWQRIQARGSVSAAHGRLWLLPLLMIAWVNLHPGFIAGFALIAAYAGLELFQMLSAGLRRAAVARLRAATPWLLACIPATLINPWGPGIYRAIERQNAMMAPTASLIGEWSRVSLNRASLHEALLWREPASAYWWLLLAVAVATAGALRQRRFGVALLLAASAVISLRYVRFQGLFAVVAVVVAGSALAARRKDKNDCKDVKDNRNLVRHNVVGLAVLGLLAALVGVRIADLASNRYYLASQDICLFGAGASWWYPERAAAFIERERLPGRIFNSYNAGGFLQWRLPGYPVYIDGRSVPFGADLFAHYLRLMAQPPDSAAWQREAEASGINTLVLVSTRYPALGAVDLRQFCESRAWAPVYLDEVSTVFLRNIEQNRPWIDRLRVDCRRQPFPEPQHASRAQLYNFYANAGAALRALGRDPWFAWQRAQSIFAGDPYLYLMKGALWQQLGRPLEAEREYRQALALRQFDEAWFALGQAQAQQGRFAEAAGSLRSAAAFSSAPFQVHQALARVFLAMKEPARALEALDRAEEESPYRGSAREAGAGFRAEVAAARAAACWMMGDRTRAITYQENSVTEDPDDLGAWLQLAQFYDAAGRPQDAEHARARAVGIER